MKKIKIQNKQNKELFTYVSDEDFEWLNTYNWHDNGNGYICTSTYKDKKQKNIYMHRMIFEKHYGYIPDNYVVDHISGDKKLNTINNLRLATQEQNTLNHRIKRKNEYIGVTEQKGKNKNNYRVTIVRKGLKEERRLFPYTNVGKINAAKYRDDRIKELHGDFVGELNFKTEEEFLYALNEAVKKDKENQYYSLSDDYKNVRKAIVTKKKKDGTIYQKEYWYGNLMINHKNYKKYFPFTELGKLQAAKWVDEKRLEFYGDSWLDYLNFKTEESYINKLIFLLYNLKDNDENEINS